MDIEMEKLKEKEKRYNNFYMDMASRAAEMSYANRLKVGCVIVKDNNIVSFGFNGMPAGMPNCCEIDKDTTHPDVRHAEENALLKCTKSGFSCDGASLYITHSPCTFCGKLIHGAGIKNVYYREEYRDPTAINTLKKFGVNCIKC